MCNKAAVEPVTSQSVHPSVPSSCVKKELSSPSWCILVIECTGSTVFSIKCLVTLFSSPEKNEVVLNHWSRVSFVNFPLWCVVVKLIVNQCVRTTWCEGCLHSLFMCCLSLYQAAVVVLKDWSEPCGVMINPKQRCPVVVLRLWC